MSAKEDKTRKGAGASASSSPAEKSQPDKPKRAGNGGVPPKGPKPPRASNAEVNERVSVVLSLIVDGICRRRSILRTLAKLHLEGKINWGPKGLGVYERPDDPAFVAECVGLRTVDIYIARATAELQAIADEPRSLAKAKVRARYERAMAGAVSGGQWDTVRKIARDMARLDGLEPTAGVRHTVEGTVNMAASGSVELVHRQGGTIEERAAAVGELFALAVRRRTAAAQAAANN